MKKLIVISLCMFLIVSMFAGCNPKDENPPQTEETKPIEETKPVEETKPTEEAKPTETEEPVEIVNLVSQICTLTEPGEGFYRMEDALNEMLERDLGVHVTFERTDIMQTFTDASLAITSGEQLDVMISFGTGALAWESGMAIPLDDLAAQYAPDILEQTGVYLDLCKIDDQLVGVTVMGVNADGYGYQMKKSFADKYGLTRNVNKLYTFDEMEEIFETIDQGEEGNIIMQVSTAEGSMGINSLFSADTFSMTYPVYGGLILGNDKYDPAKVINIYETEEYAAYAQKMYEWAQKGWISPDAAVTTDSADEILAREDVLGWFSYGSFDDRLNQKVAWTDELVIFNTQPSARTGSLAGMMWHITPTSEHPEKAMEFLNYFYKNPEAFALVQFGFEGEEYDVVQRDGDLKLARWKATNPLELPYYIAYPWIGNQLNLPVFEPNPINMNEIKLEIETNIPESYTSPALGYVFDASNYSAEIAAITSVMQKYLPTLSAGAADPSTLLPEFYAELEAAGLSKVIAANQAQLDEFIALKNQ